MIADNDAPQLGCRDVAFVAADSVRDTVRSWEVMEAQSENAALYTSFAMRYIIYNVV